MDGYIIFVSNNKELLLLLLQQYFSEFDVKSSKYSDFYWKSLPKFNDITLNDEAKKNLKMEHDQTLNTVYTRD